VGIWTTAKCIAMLFAHQPIRMCGAIETKMVAGYEYDEYKNINLKYRVFCNVGRITARRVALNLIGNVSQPGI
jgi:hypothetical protein